jgi:epoxide hydrolase
MKNDRISPFRIDVAPELLSDLRQRLKNTRWSYQVQGTSWEAGTDLNYLKELVAYWHDTYDWRKHEAALNQFAHFKTEVDDIGIHFIHEGGDEEMGRFVQSARGFRALPRGHQSPAP